jgi:release factor glutamine methyltransferase
MKFLLKEFQIYVIISKKLIRYECFLEIISSILQKYFSFMSKAPAAILVSELTTSLQLHFDDIESQAIAHRILDISFDCTKLDIYMGKELTRPADWLDILARLKNGEPFQYVLGKAFFRSEVFEVNSNTLIPRPETAELVDLVLEKLPTWKTNPTVLDVGTGSGCIPISIKMEQAHAQVYAWDISNEALAVAKRNADKLHVEVQFSQTDLFKWAESTQLWDIIVSNPPYVLEEEASQMERHVLDFEPHLALFVPNDDPLKYYKALSDFASSSLHTHGWLVLEINRAYGQEIIELLNLNGFTNISLHTDFRDNHRFVSAMKS